MTLFQAALGADREVSVRCVRVGGKMQVNVVRLKKSTLTPKGPIYTTIHEVVASS